MPKTADGTVWMIRTVKVAKDVAVKARTSAMSTLGRVLVNAPPERPDERQPLTKMTLIRRCAAFRPRPVTTITAAAKHALRATRPASTSTSIFSASSGASHHEVAGAHGWSAAAHCLGSCRPVVGHAPDKHPARHVLAAVAEPSCQRLDVHVNGPPARDALQGSQLAAACGSSLIQPRREDFRR